MTAFAHNNRTVVLTVLAALFAAPNAVFSAGPVRALSSGDDAVWACGDSGLVMKSTDGGMTFSRVEQPGTADLRAISLEGPAAAFIGGLPVTGGLAGMGGGVIVRTDDGGLTFNSIPFDKPGRLYDGTVRGDSALVLGQVSGSSGWGIWLTTSGGRQWRSLEGPGEAGYLSTACLQGVHEGYLFGPRRRVITLGGRGGLNVLPSPLEGGEAINASASAGDDVWVAGRQGTVMSGAPPERRWSRHNLPFPPGVRRLAGFEAVAFRGRRGVIAGGLAGLLFCTTDGGRNFTARAAPLPGPVHSVAFLGDNILLAGGDAGRIWRSEDFGATWRLAAGREKTDILFVAAAADRSIYPAIVSHSLAGCSVAVLYATVPDGGNGYDPRPPLASAAVRAGAGGVSFLEDFTSVVGTRLADHAAAEDIERYWSEQLDLDAGDEMARQVAAAVRLYRPAVLAVGPGGRGPRGVRAENRYVSRAALDAVIGAGIEDDDAADILPDPHRVRRVFAGVEENETWHPPWDREPAYARRPSLLVDGALFPAGAVTCVGVRAAAAVWSLGGYGFADRPPRRTAYVDAAREGKVYALMTAGLPGCAGYVLPRAAVSEALAGMAGCVQFRFADDSGDLPALRRRLAAEARKEAPDAGADPALLACDRLLMLWKRFMETGRPREAAATMELFLEHGRGHPLFARMNVIRFSHLCSSEFRLTPAGNPAGSVARDSPSFIRAVKSFSRWRRWCYTPSGTILYAHALCAAGKIREGLGVFNGVTEKNYGPLWAAYAGNETAIRGGARPSRRRCRTAGATFVKARGTVDGRLDEPFWSDLPSHALHPAGGGDRAGPAGELKLFRSIGSLAVGLRLDYATARRWTIALAIDGDRDVWTQFVLRLDGGGRRTCALAARLGPELKLPSKIVPAAVSRRQLGDLFFEIAVPLSLFGEPTAGRICNFQLRAESAGSGGRRVLYFSPQPDRRLLPERYGLVRIPAAGTATDGR